MIAVPVSGDVRPTVVGAPAYFAQHPKPAHPRDLVARGELVAVVEEFSAPVSGFYPY